MRVMRRDLPVPDELTGSNVEHDERVRVKVRTVARAVIEYRHWIADRNIEPPRFHIERHRAPHCSTALQPRMRIGPRIRARLIVIRNGIEAPDGRARANIEGAHPSLCL